MHTVAAGPPITPADRLGLTFFFAVVAHAILILGVTFSPEDRAHTDSNTLDVILVQHQSEKPPEDADYLAQASQDGGGESEDKARPATPLPAPFAGPEPSPASAAPPLEPEPPAEVEKPTPPAPPPPPEPPAPEPQMAQKKAPAPQKVVQAPPPQPKPKKKPQTEAKAPPEPAPEPKPTKTVNAAALVQKSLAMASLSAEIDRKLKAYAERPRHKWINSRTREYKYAAYMEAWRLKVERIGNLNYPDEARRRRLSGNLLLDVALNADGTINEITLRRSSGHRVLDDAAIRIVKLAAPYAPFPDNISEETDILHIERTWQFLSSNRLASK